MGTTKETVINAMNSKVSVDRVLLILLLAGIVIYFARGCFTPTPNAAPTVTTTEKHDTTYIPQPTVTLPQVQPIIIRSDAASPIVIPPQYQNNSTDIKELTAQVKELAAQFYAVNRYNDSIPLRDSSGKRVGVVNIEQDVSENKIKALRPSYSLLFPHIVDRYETVKTFPYVPRNQVYAGFEIGGNQARYLNDFAAGLMFKNKRDQIIKAAATIDLGARIGVRVGYYGKISFVK